MLAVWASPHEALCSDGVVAPDGFAPWVGPHLGVVLDRCHPPGAAVAANRDAALPARDGLSVLLMEVLCPFRSASMSSHVHRE
jgi:hypothetical protein